MKLSRRLILPSALVSSAALALGAMCPRAAHSPPPAAEPVVHCQVPCGIYGDQMRIDMLMEDAATIEKAMKSLAAMDEESRPSKNQMVRWIMNKESHAQNIQDTVAAYWLAQRVKKPKDATDARARASYLGQLEAMHDITVAAMKCKQTNDAGHVETLRKRALEFSATYFSEDDLKHIREHHGAGEHR